MVKYVPAAVPTCILQAHFKKTAKVLSNTGNAYAMFLYVFFSDCLYKAYVVDTIQMGTHNIKLCP